MHPGSDFATSEFFALDNTANSLYNLYMQLEVG